MSPVRCLSSQAMERLFKWRNPEGTEQDWIPLPSDSLTCGSPPMPIPSIRSAGLSFSGVPSVTKRLVTQVALTGLCVAATVETVAYGALALVSKAFCLSSISDKFVKKLQSSRFSILWTVCAMRHNLVVRNIFTHESFERRNFSWSCREEDRLYCKSREEFFDKEETWRKEQIVRSLERYREEMIEWQREEVRRLEGIIEEQGQERQEIQTRFLRILDQLSQEELSAELSRRPVRPESFASQVQESSRRFEEAERRYLRTRAEWALGFIEQRGGGQYRPVSRAEIQSIITKGVDFLCEHIIEGTDQSFKERFATIDVDLIQYVLAKAVWFYVCGPEREMPVLEAFKEETKSEIMRLRELFEKDELKDTFSTVEKFEKGIPDGYSQDKWNKLHAVAFIEVRGGFIAECWPRAVIRLGLLEESVS